MSAPDPTSPSPTRVLVVCTANICRSPVAAQLLRDRSRTRGVDVAVLSAGFLEDGRAADPTMVSLAAKRGITVGDHRSRVVDADLVQGSDLVVTMERRHARELVVMVPEAGHRVHTLLALAAAGREVSPDSGLETWLQAVTEQRSPADLMGDRGPDQIPDPYGRSKRHYRTCLDTLDGAVSDLVHVLSHSA